MNELKSKRSELIFLKINNWGKFQIRKELNSMSYFRLQNDIFYDAKFASLTTTGKLLWFYLLCEASRQYVGGNPDRSDGQVQLNMHLTSRQTGCNPRHIRSSIVDLEQLRMVTMISNTNLCSILEKRREEEKREENIAIAPASRVKVRKASSSSTQVVKKNSLQTEFDSAKTEEPQQPAESGKSSKALQTKSETSQPNLLGAYYDLWRSRYGEKLARKPADGAILKRIASVNGHEQTLRMLQAFFTMPDAWAVKKAHDLFTFERMLSEVVRFMNSGKVFTNTATKEADETIHHRQKNSEEDMRFIEENPHLFENRRTSLLEG